MKRNTLSILTIIIALFFYNCNQKSTQPIIEEAQSTIQENYEGDWLVTTNIFDSTLTFNRIEQPDSVIPYGSKFTFNKENLNYKDLNPAPSCGNGIFFLDSCAYQKENKQLTLFFKGGYAMEYNFIYKAKYLLQEKTDSAFTLIRTKILIDEKNSIY